MPFSFKKLSIPEVLLVESHCFGDSRGYFCETFHENIFYDAGITERFVQDNYSFSKANVLRGMHYQLPPFAQGKLVWVIDGKILDVAVDMRANSPTLGQWLAVELSSDSHSMLWIPPGFAHGFLTLSESARLHYKCTSIYSPEHEAGFIWNDPEIDIDWPTRDAHVSARDGQLPSFAEAPKH